jgi:hypothetical protein
MSASRALTSLCLVVASLLGCKTADEQEQPSPVTADEAAGVFARQICASLYTCACAPEFASEDECVDQLSAQYQARIDELLGWGVSWNADCAGQMVASWSKWQCLGPNQARAEALYDARVCPIVKGALEDGFECSPFSIGDECSAGSVCVSGICVATQVPVPIGSTCEYDWQELPCAAGSYCGYNNTDGGRICKSQPAAGDACETAEGITCGLPSQGLVCPFETLVCEPAPSVGEPCFEGFYCGAGNYCDGGLDFTCQERFELGDGCGADAVCPVDASCIGSICEADTPAACALENFNF